MDILIGMFSGIVSGVLSSIIASILLKKSKPKLIISSEIAKSIDDKGNYNYRVKIVNQSKSYVKIVSICAYLMTRTNAEGGSVLNSKPVKIINKNIGFIDPYNEEDTDSKYAIRIGLDCNLEKIWTEDQFTFLEIKICCENESNGSGKVFCKCYNKKNTSIIYGEFETHKNISVRKLE